MGLFANYRSANRTGPPPAPFVTLAEAKAHLRMTHGYFDDLLTSHIAAACAELNGLDTRSGRNLTPQSWHVWVKTTGWSGSIPIRVPDVTAVTAVAVFDGTDMATVSTFRYGFLGPDTFWYDTTTNRPVASDDLPADTRFTVIAGPSSVPLEAKQAALLRVEQLFSGYDAAREAAWQRLANRFYRFKEPDQDA